MVVIHQSFHLRFLALLIKDSADKQCKTFFSALLTSQGQIFLESVWLYSVSKKIRLIRLSNYSNIKKVPFVAIRNSPLQTFFFIFLQILFSAVVQLCYLLRIKSLEKYFCDNKTFIKAIFLESRI